MRIAVVGLVLAVVGALAAAIADVTVPFAAIGHGSYSRAPVADGLTVLPTQPPCGAASGSPCAARFAYAPNQKLTVWFAVRNESRVPLTLDGVPRRWFDQFPSELLTRPVAALDGGDPVRGIPKAIEATPFGAVVLAPLEERMVGVEFRTTADVAYACAHWMTGTGIGWDRIPVAWHWVAREHETEINLAKPITLMAPSATDCAG
jgi:hypothetical protein